MQRRNQCVLSALKNNKGARTCALLGDMLELGTDSEKMHFEIGEYIAKSGISLLFTFGKGAKAYAEGAKKAGFSEGDLFSVESKDDFEICAQIILEKLCDKDILLVKASRSIAAERVIKYMSAHINNK